MPIFRANWKRSMMRTPQSPESVETIDVTTMMPKTRNSASFLSTPKMMIRIFTIARFTQPRMMQLIGSPR